MCLGCTCVLSMVLSTGYSGSFVGGVLCSVCLWVCWVLLCGRGGDRGLYTVVVWYCLFDGCVCRRSCFA